MNKNKKEFITKILNNGAKPAVDLKLNIGDEELLIKVKQQLSFEEKLDVIKEIYNFVCDVEGDDGGIISLDRYQPYLRQYAKRFSVIFHYSDIDLELTSGKDASLINNLVMNTNLYEKIYEIAKEDISYVFSSADELIDNYRDAAIRNNGFVSVINIFTKTLDKFSNFDGKEILKLVDKLKGLDIVNLVTKINKE